MITKEDARKLACEAFNAAIKHIQDKMGVTEGDAAGHFWDNDHNTQDAERTIDMLADYIEFEYDLEQQYQAWLDTAQMIGRTSDE